MWWRSEDTQAMWDEITIGATFDRVLDDDDLVILNRQPSLSKHSVIAMRLKVGRGVETDVISFNPCITTTFNADFDGDEMNMFAGYGQEARAELLELCHISQNMYDEITGKMYVQPIQDTVSAVYMMTKSRQPVSLEVFFDCTGITLKDGYGRGEKDTYNLFSVALPYDLEWDSGDVVITNGELINGVIDAQILCNQLAIHIYKVHGKDILCKFIKDIQLVSLRWLDDKGLTTSLQNCTWTKETREELDPSMTSTDFQNLAMSISQTLEEDNPISIMLRSGAKGKATGPMQMGGCLGQQYIYGHKPKVVRNPKTDKDHGFIQSCYTRGLDEQEYLVQAMASLSGIVDVGVGVSDIGYTNRKVTKLMAGVVEEYNGITTTDGMVVQFHK